MQNFADTSTPHGVGPNGPGHPDSISRPDPTSLPVPTPADPASATYSYPFAVRRRQWWRGVLAILGIILGFVIGQLISLPVVLLAEAFPGLDGGLALGPLSFLGINLSLITLIPVSLLLSKLLYGSAADLLSVLGRLRWGLMARAALIVVPVWAVLMGAGLLLGIEVPNGPAVWLLLLVCVLTTPLQAAGEEMAFRGLLLRATATWAPGRGGLLVGIVVSSLMFAVAHFVSDPWMFSYFFLFGASLAVITWRTGGLEVGILIHAWHNTVSFVVGLLTVGSIDALITRNDTNPGAWMLLYDVLFVGAAAITWIVAHRRGVTRTATLPVTGGASHG